MGWAKSAFTSIGLTIPALGIDLIGGAGGNDVEVCWN